MITVKLPVQELKRLYCKYLYRSDLWKAIENKDSKKAEELYKEALKKAREYEVIE